MVVVVRLYLWVGLERVEDVLAEAYWRIAVFGYGWSALRFFNALCWLASPPPALVASQVR